MAATDVQEGIIYLPEDLVRKSPGFTLDIGKYCTHTRTHAHTFNFSKEKLVKKS